MLFFEHTGDSTTGEEMTWQALANLREQQVASLAYFNVFALFAVAAVLLLPLVLLMKRAVAKKGTHVAAE